MSDAAARIGTARGRLARVLYIGASLTGIALAALASQSVIEQSALAAPWWFASVAVPMMVAPVLILCLATFAPLGALRVVAGILAVAYIVGIALLPASLSSSELPGGLQPWMIDLLPMISLTTAIGARPATAWAFLLVACGESAVVRYTTSGIGGFAGASTALQEALYNATTIAVFVAIALATQRAARLRDEAADRAAADAVLLASAEAEYLQRAQVAALMHDEVISTLIAAVRSTPASAPLIRASARRALDRIDTLSAEEVEGATCTLDALVASLRETAVSIAPDSALHIRSTEDARVPLAVERAIVGAAAEALRNSERHSPGEHTRRAVTVDALANAVTVSVEDDGPGFDPARVPEGRFGVRYSILRRMDMLEGGSARLSSQRDHGTRVELTWRRDAG